MVKQIEHKYIKRICVCFELNKKCETLKTRTPDIKKSPIPLSEADLSSLKQMLSMPRITIVRAILISVGQFLF